MKVNLDFKPKRKTLWDLFWYIVRSERNKSSLSGYFREQSMKLDCDEWFKLTDKCPSKELIKRYNLDRDACNDFFTWWLYEKYFNGELIEKKC